MMITRIESILNFGAFRGWKWFIVNELRIALRMNYMV